MNMTLYQLSGAYLQLAHTLADGDFDAQTIADSIEASGITDEIVVKAQNIEHIARAAESHHLAIDAEIARLQALKAQRQRTANGLRSYLKSAMEMAGIERLECDLFKISIAKNPAAVDIFDPLSLPAVYMVVPEPKPAMPDKKAIAAAIKAGQEVPGARMTQGTRLKVG